MTSGWRSAIHFLEKSKPLNTGSQYGVSVFLLSHAAPMAGTWKTFTLATILATLLPLRLAAITFYRSATLQHHLGILLLGESGHGRRDVLKRQPDSGVLFGVFVDVAAELDHAAPVARENGLALLLRHGPLREVGTLVLLEFFAVGGLHQRHAEHVDVIALTRALRIDLGGARNVIESLGWLYASGFFGFSHDPIFRCLRLARGGRCADGQSAVAVLAPKP